uniref:Uncharacterized protein n=1 Tax=Rhizophora mucronata TaxID=61149 RepID=A0A2P2J1W9_RHIMU
MTSPTILRIYQGTTRTQDTSKRETVGQKTLADHFIV